MGRLDELGVLENPLDLLGGGVAAHVLLLKYLPQVRPVTDAVDDVLADLRSRSESPRLPKKILSQKLCLSSLMLSTLSGGAPPTLP